MKRLIFFVLFLFCRLIPCTHILFAQAVGLRPKTSKSAAADTMRKIDILGAKKLQIKTINDTTKLQILTGNVRLRQGATLFMCDSCIINETQDLFEAFGNVHINDSDTANIYSDYMKYLTHTKIAYFKNNVKLTDGKGELTTPELEYDVNTKIGVYTKGGRVKNKKTVLTSNEGYYYADLKDVYFKKNVLLKDPSYNLKTDSLLYSTQFETVRFITKTVIIDSNKRQITTSEGFYDMKRGKAEFGKRPVILDGNTTITGDRIAFDDSSGISQALGNAIIVDTAQGQTIIANEIFRNRKTEAILATKKPIMIIKQDNDSIYVTADTLFSARLTDLYSRPESFKKELEATAIDSLAISDSLTPISVISKTDSTTVVTDADPVLKSDSLIQPKLINIKDSALAIDPIIGNIIRPTLDTLAKSDTLKYLNNPITMKPQTIKLINKHTQVKQSNSSDNASFSPKRTPAIKNTLKGKTMLDIKQNDSANRYFEAYRNVRIFSDSMQAICDSVFYSFKDSVFRMYYNPVIWANNSQITGDTAHLFTKNKKIDKLQVIDNSLVVNLLEKEAFNQVKSSRIDAYFFNGNIDSVRAKGSAECIYYLLDKDSAYTGINQSQSDIMDIYFKNKELNRIVFRSQVKGTLWPIKQKSPAEMKLSNFKWFEAKRPKTKYELFE